MWSEVISIFGGTIALTGGYFGIYKLGWYISRKEQIDNFTKMIDDLKEQQDTHDDLIIKYEEHLVKLKEHSIYKK
tara:strand:+ start:1344 stop:1568 length:225 start_codon:yes stop_codon:yes gene_type:complete